MKEKENMTQNVLNVNIAHDELVIMGVCGLECMVTDCDMS